MHLNNKGQTLVMFVLMLPVLLLVLMLVIDIGNAYYEKEHLNNLNKQVIESYLDKRMEEEELGDLITINDKKIKYKINTDDNTINIILNKEIKSILGQIINRKTSMVVSSYRGKTTDGKKEIKKIDWE